MITTRPDNLIYTYRGKQLQRLRPGDIVWTWCSQHMDRTDHLWTGHKLVCLECQPEMKPDAAQVDGEQPK